MGHSVEEEEEEETLQKDGCSRAMVLGYEGSTFHGDEMVGLLEDLHVKSSGRHILHNEYVVRCDGSIIHAVASRISGIVQ